MTFVLPSAPTLRHVLVIGVDAVRFDLLGPELTPVIWAFGQDGFLTPVMIDGTTPTWSGACWATLVTGCDAGAAYREAAAAADRRAGQLLRAVRSRPGYAEEGWTVVVVTDHGHLDQRGHAAGSPRS
jgi:membrane-anchored protein YejM (alkaline phosphatase superfamily)